MKTMRFDEAVDAALQREMSENPRIVVFGEDVPSLRMALRTQFGPDRVMAAPISEGAFLGAAMGAAMAGLRPVAELYMTDFALVGADAIINQMAKLEAFSGGRWTCPLVIRAGCGGGYGDGGQHEQALWGLFGQIPGLTVVVPSTPADAFGAMLAALRHDGPVLLCEHKLLSSQLLEALGGSHRDTVQIDVPEAGARGEVDVRMEPMPLGRAVVRRVGTDVTIASLAVGVHRSLQAARRLESDGVSCEVIDLRTVRPLDAETVIASVEKTGTLVVVDEDYRDFGLSGELAARVLESGSSPAYARVCVEDTIPFSAQGEHDALPNVDRIVDAVRAL